MTNRRIDIGLIAAAVVVALLLGALAFYPGVLAPGYNSNVVNYEHKIEAGPGENVTSEVEFEAGTDLEDITYRYEDLSPTAQELFDRTLAAGFGTYTADICTEHVIVCDGYYQEELPPEFTYGESLDNALLYTVIEYNGDEYLLRTGVDRTANNPNFLYGFYWIFFRGLLLLHAGAIATATLIRLYRGTNTNNQIYAMLVGGGAVSATVGFLIPYIQMAGLVSGPGQLFWLVTVVVFGYVAAAFFWVAAAVATSTQW